MIEHIQNIFKRIFSSEETIIFSLIIVFLLIILGFFIEILTPFIISIIVAYLLVGLQKNIENYKHSGKIYVSNLGKLNQTILSILDFIKLLFIKSDEHLRKKEHNIINEKINLDERF